MNVVRIEDIQDVIVEMRDQQILIDADVATLYGVETKRINEVVKNNPERFPEGYIFQLSPVEKKELVENFDQFKKLKHSPVNPKAFTERPSCLLKMVGLFRSELKLCRERSPWIKKNVVNSRFL